MNKLAELERLRFVINRDGAEIALKYARDMIRVYRLAARQPNLKFYRFKYVEAAYSFRHLLRTIKGNPNELE